MMFCFLSFPPPCSARGDSSSRSHSRSRGRSSSRSSSRSSKSSHSRSPSGSRSRSRSRSYSRSRSKADRHVRAQRCSTSPEEGRRVGSTLTGVCQQVAKQIQVVSESLSLQIQIQLALTCQEAARSQVSQLLPSVRLLNPLSPPTGIIEYNRSFH